jgi:hypothetical protein
MEIEKIQIVDLLSTYIHLNKEIKKLDAVLGEDAFSNYFISIDIFLDIILTMCGVPEEETPFEALGFSFTDFLEDENFRELEDATQESLWEYGFCRDNNYEKIWKLFDIEGDDEVDLACDITVMALIDKYSIQQNYITRREES